MATSTEKGLVFDISLELETLKREAEQASNILSGIGRNAQQQGKVMDDAFTQMQDSVTKKVRNIGAAMAGMFAAGQLKGFASRVIEVRGAFQQLSVAFTTMLGDKAKADQLLQEAADFAAKTPFELSDVAGGAKQLLAYGTAAEDVIGDIEMLGNVASGLSVPLNDMIYLYGTLKAQGTAYTMDIRQFAGRGVPIYQELAKVMGVSVKEVNELVSAGKVGFPQVQQAFRNMTSEGGQFYNLMREQSKTITGQISNLQDQISGMFNKIGASSEGVINAGLEGVSFLLEHYEEIGKSLVALIALYGEYKASLIAVSAYQKAMTATKHTEEAASLFQLLSAEQQAMISKQNLSKTSAEYYAVVSAEAQNNVKAAQAALEKARIEVKASAQTVAAKKAEYISAQQLLSQKKAELAQVTATGTQKQVEAAQRRVNAAEIKKEAAAKAYLNASYDLSAKKVAVETAAKKANTVATQVNTAAQKAGAKAATLFAVVQGKLVAAFNKLKLAMLSNPFTAILLAVTALGAGIYKLVTRQTEAEKAQKKLNEAIADASANAAAEAMQVDVLFGRLQNATKGTQEYAEAKQSIIDKYGSYLDGMDEEIKSLNDVAAAYEVVKQKAQEAANRQAISSVIQVQTEIVGNKRSETYDDIEELLSKYLGEEKASEYMVKIKPIIMSGESAEGNQDFRNIGIEANHARSDLASLLNAMVGGKTALEKMEAKISELREVEAAANETMNKAYEKFGTETAETGKTAEEEAARLVSVAEQLEEARKRLAEVNAAISDIRTGMIQVEDPEAEISGLMEQADKYRKTIEILTGIKQSGSGRKSKHDYTDEIDDIKRQLEEREAEELSALESSARDLSEAKIKADEAAAAKERAFRQSQSALSLADTLSIMKRNTQAELKQNEADLKQELDQIEKEYEEKIRLREELAKKEYLQANPGKTEKDYRAQKQEVKLSEDDEKEKQQRITTVKLQYEAQAQQIQDQGTTDQYAEALKRYQDYGQQYLRMTQQLMQQKQAIESSYGAGSEESQSFDTYAQQALTEIGSYIGVQDEMFGGWMQQVVTMGLNQVLTQLQTAKEQLSVAMANSGGDTSQTAKLQAKINLLEQQIQNLTKKGGLKTDNLKSAAKVLDNVTDAVMGVVDGFENMDESTKAIFDGIGQVSSLTSQMISSIANLVQMSTSSMMGTAMAAATAMQTVEKASVILTIISLALQIIQAIINAVANAKAAKKEKEIQRIQKQVDSLEDSYDDLSDAIDKSYGATKKSLILEQQRNLEQQKALIEQQKQLEAEKGKKADEDKLQEYEDKIEEINDQIAEIPEQAAEAIMGQSVQDAIESFADAYMSAWEAGGDKADIKEAAKEMIKTAALQIIRDSPAMTKAVEDFYNTVMQAMEDGIIDDTEASLINRLTEDIMNGDVIPEGLENLDVFKNQGDRSASEKGLESASQDSIDELNGRFTAIQSHTYQINDNVKLIVGYASQQLSILAQIEENTRMLNSIGSDIVAVRSGINDMNIHGVAIQKL